MFRFLLLLLALLPLAAAQQEYEANAQTDCDTNGSSVLGYTCSKSNHATSSACTSYLAYRSDLPTYGSPITVAYLLNASATAVASVNSVPIASPVQNDSLLVVPVPCACTAAGHYQHDAAYVIQFDYENYFSIANETYQGLSTCQALMAQNPAHDSLDLYPGIPLTVPLRCACPSARQAAAGVKYLVTYLLDWDDDASTVADRFRADYQALLEANTITDDTTVYPFTTMLVPLKDPPTSEVPEPPSPAPTPSDLASAPTMSNEPSNGPSARWRVTVCVGVGCSVLASGAVLALLLLWHRQHGDRGDRSTTISSLESAALDGHAKGALRTAASLMWPTVAAVDVREAVGSLTVYDYGDLEKATAGFSEEQHIGNSSVYRAVISGNSAAVKRVPGDVGCEVSVLGRVNHSSVIRLSGLCMHGGYTYMVFEYAENGALSDWLHGGDHEGRALGWSQRVQVALDVAGGLNYLHNYTNPPYVHKNLKSSNILLDSCFRAKLSNFGLARAITADAEDEGRGLWMTQHVVGTQGYLAPEYVEHGLIGPQLDVFAFGVLVLQLLSGKEAAMAPAREDDDDGGKNGKVLWLWEEVERLGVDDGAEDLVKAFIDARLGGQYPLDVAFAMVALALRCVAREPQARPSIAEVLLSLSGVYNWSLNWDPQCPQVTGTPAR